MAVLDQIAHARLIQNKPEVCLVAGVQVKYFESSMKGYCGSEEIDWVLNFHKYEAEGVPGLLLDKVKRPDARCQAIAGALLRNYIDARVVPVNTLIENKGSELMPHVLLIPNLFVAATGKGVASWVVQVLYDMLLARSVQGKPTVAYIEGMSGLLAEYGEPFADFLSGFRKILK